MEKGNLKDPLYALGIHLGEFLIDDLIMNYLEYPYSNAGDALSAFEASLRGAPICYLILSHFWTSAGTLEGLRCKNPLCKSYEKGFYAVNQRKLRARGFVRSRIPGMQRHKADNIQ